MQGFSYSEYAAKSIEIFNLLKNDQEGNWIQRLNRRERSRAKFQRIWSDRFPRSTVKEYALLLKANEQFKRQVIDACKLRLLDF
jgi:hypothetical protein